MKKKLITKVLFFFPAALLLIFLCTSCDPDSKIAAESALTASSPAVASFAEGRVVDSIGGAPVEGAVVAVKGTAYSAVTDTNGVFLIENIQPGLYDLSVTKAGRAGSVLEQVSLATGKSGIEIVQPLYSYDARAVTPPAIFISGIERHKTYYGIIPIEVTVSAGSCPVAATEFHKSIYLKIGATAMNYYEEAAGSGNSISFKWNTTLFPPGNLIVKAVAYDNNNNRCELNIPVAVQKGTGQAPGVVPLKDYYTITATTYGQSMDITRAYADLPCRDVYESTGTRAPADSTILVEFAVQKYYDGIVIYKSQAEAGDYLLAGQTTDVDSGYYNFVDYASTLEPDTTVYYKLAFFNRNGIGPVTDVIPVRILPRYNLSLVSPADKAFITDMSPTVGWTCDIIPGAQRTDWVVVKNVLDATFVAYSFLINETEFTLPDLLYNNSYEWDVRSYYEYVNSTEKANVLSRSFPRGKGASDFSLNGAFYFTLIEQE